MVKLNSVEWKRGTDRGTLLEETGKTEMEL